MTARRVPDLLRARAAAAPDDLALAVHAGPCLTYGSWERRSNAVARGLRACGLRPGGRVVLFFGNARWTEYAVAYLATHKAGGVAVPTSPRLSAAELAHVLDHASATLLVCHPDLPPTVGTPAPVTVEELESGQSSEPFTGEAGEPELAEIIYTSGTTGTPKGVACTHESILVHDLPAGPQPERVSFAHAFPVGTNAGQECLRMPLRRAATAFVLDPFDPERLCALIAERRIQRLQLVPAMARVLVDTGAPGRHDVSSVERITLSSAPVPPALLPRLAAAFPQASLWNAYALTESGGARTLMRYDPARPTAVGQPVGRTELRVVDGSDADVPPGRIGEILLRRPGAPHRTYYRDPEATAAAFDDGWLRTGDLGYLDEDGYLHLVDRRKDVIISGGTNISSLEVENALHEHPSVREAGVFAVPHDVLGQDVAAAVVAEPRPDVRELQAFVRQRLGEHKVPRRVVFVDELPRNESGKVRKRLLRERFGDAPTPATAAPARNDRDDVERVVTTVWQEVLARDDVGVDDDFFDLGGQSLAATQVVARLREAFGIDLPVTAVFEHPTVAELAGDLRRLRRGA